MAYVVDCGDGAARQLVSAGVPLATLRHVFIRISISDHNADYGSLVLLAWTAGLRTRVDTWGPPPLERMTRLFFDESERHRHADLERGARAVDPAGLRTRVACGRRRDDTFEGP